MRQVDRIEAGARNFFADFSKGFDLIDHYLGSVRHRGHKFGSYFFSGKQVYFREISSIGQSETEPEAVLAQNPSKLLI
jgi:hypothetical protein